MDVSKTKVMLSALVSLSFLGSPFVYADTSAADGQLVENAKSGVNWLDKNSMEKMHDWSVIASFAATNQFQRSTWTTDETSKLKATTDDARFVLGLLAAGQDPHQYNGTDYVKALAASQNVTGTDVGKFADNLDGTGTDLINVQAWSIIALQDAGATHYDWLAARNWLIQHQNADGGFGYSKSYSDSDPDDTATALIALSMLGIQRSQNVMVKGLKYLASTQSSDGGFGSGGTSNSDSTGVVVDALTALGIDPTTWIQGQADPKTALLAFADKTSGGFNFDNTGSSWSGVNAFSTRDGLIGLGALIYHQSTYQRLHWKRLDHLNAYWNQVAANGGVKVNHTWKDWLNVSALATAGSYASSLTTYWQTVMQAHGMYVSRTWVSWNEQLAEKALIASFGLNTVNLNHLNPELTA